MSKSTFIPTGDDEIDRVRKDLEDSPTDSDNYQERLILLRAWRGLLQRQGANLESVAPLHNTLIAAVREEDLETVFSATDEFARRLEEIHADVHE